MVDSVVGYIDSNLEGVLAGGCAVGFGLHVNNDERDAAKQGVVNVE